MYKILFIIIFVSCTNNKIIIPTSAVIKAKYLVHDEVNSPKLSHSKTLKVGEFEFDIEDKYVFNENGEFVEFWNYLAEGPIIMNLKELNKDKQYLKTIGAENLTIKWGLNKETIIIKNDTLFIEKIFPHEKLIWIKQDNYSKKNGRRILIEYI